jgi:hypothetical protein
MGLIKNKFGYLEFISYIRIVIERVIKNKSYV